MVSYLFLGIALLAGLILIGRWYVSADSRQVMRFLKWLAFGLLATVIVGLAVTGRLAWAFAAMPALLVWFQRVRALFNVGKAFSRMAGAAKGRGTGQASTVETRFVRMTLDHDSGEMSGEVLEGAYAGRRLGDMTEAEVIDLLAACRAADPQSAQVVEAYLERTHPGWRGAGGDQAENGAAAPSGDMGRAEALKVLGLEEGASESAVKEAHRRLIRTVHPDHGGSSYLAAKINQAKDVLLGG